MTPKILRPATICKDTERHEVKSDKAVYPMRRCAPAMRDGVALSGNVLSARSCKGARDAGKGARHIKKGRVIDTTFFVTPEKPGYIVVTK